MDIPSDRHGERMTHERVVLQLNGRGLLGGSCNSRGAETGREGGVNIYNTSRKSMKEPYIICIYLYYIIFLDHEVLLERNCN